MTPDDLNFRHLLYFWAVAKEGSITRAAERLNLSVQTISTQLAVLERRDQGNERPFEHDTLPAVLGETRPLKSRGTYRAAP